MNLPLPRLVLDTNVVLDCFVFEDRHVASLRSALEAGRVQALVDDYTLTELLRVLAYDQCGLSDARRIEVLEHYRRNVTYPELPEHFSSATLLLPPGFPQCRDPDDQPFLALAYHAAADALVTKDKALLKLRKKVRKFGVTIVSPTELQLI